MKPSWQQRQEQMRRQQEQMRRKQEQMRRQMEMAAWAEQQKIMDQKDQEAVKPRHDADDRFTQVEIKAAALREEWLAGALTEAQFKERLKELMVQDDQGSWWMIGTQSGEWYRYDGSNWLPATPQGRSSSFSPRRSAPQPSARAEARPRRTGELIGVMVRLAFFGALGLLAGYMFFEDSEYGFLVIVAIWSIGIITTLRRLVR